MANPTTKTAEDDNWILPIGLTIAIFLVSIWFVHDDPTANGVQFVLAAGAAAILGWGYWLTQKGRGAELQVLRDRLIMALGIGGALAYCNFGHLHFGNFVHVWDTYHYYMGAKYFPEVKYDLLYDCAAVADAESGLKAAAAQRTITDLRTNVMHKADQVVAHPEICTSQFSKARWEDFKKDIAYFRGRVNAKRWEEIHQDHGYNATPVWTLAGWVLTNSGAATNEQIVALNLIDPLYLALMALMLYWAFGPRIFALGMLVLGCNFPGRYYWTGGAFLRHDWLFYTVAVVCLLKKEKFMLAGLALSYATLLRLFPGLMVVGPLFAGIELLRVNKKLDPRFLKFVGGGAIGVAVLFPLSLKFGGSAPDAGVPAKRSVIMGSILALDTRAPLANATVSADESHTTVTDGAGAFRLEVLPGKQTISVKAPSFEAGEPFLEDLPENQELKVTYGLLPPQTGSAAHPDRRVELSRAPLPSLVTGPLDIWIKFAQNTSKHAATPLTNHMGLRTVVSYRPDSTGTWLRDASAIDPWAKWKETRLQKFHEAKGLFILMLLGLAAMIYFAVRQTGGELWVAAALGTGYIVAGAELTCYYYCFMVGMIALHEKRREVGIVLMVMLATTQMITWTGVGGVSSWLDQQYTTMTVASLAACIGIWFLFSKRGEPLCLAPEGPAVVWPVAPVRTDFDDRKKKKRKK